MKRFQLIPHPDMPPKAVRGVEVGIVYDVDEILLTFMVQGGENVAVPLWLPSARANHLWKTTCFEMFLAPVGSPTYFEFNYSPSTQWAAYRLESYRAGMRDLLLSIEPFIERGEMLSGYFIEIDQDLTDIPPGTLQLGLSAVIEECDGTKSYWALAHAPGPPDFHNRDCFIATLPALDPS